MEPIIWGFDVPQGIKFDLLNEQITAIFPSAQLNGGGTHIDVIFPDALANPDSTKARLIAICAAHDPKQPSAAEQAAIAQEQAAVTLKGELVQVAQRLATFKAASLDDVNALAQDLAVLVQAIIGFY